MNILLGLIVIGLIALLVFAAPDEAEDKQDDTYESGWLSREPYKHKYEEDIYIPHKKQEEEEPETRAQKFRRENSMREVMKRGGYLTTGERMEAMYGACEEAAQCFPEDYYTEE